MTQRNMIICENDTPNVKIFKTKLAKRDNLTILKSWGIKRNELLKKKKLKERGMK